MTDTEAMQRLALYRLERDLTYTSLACEMTRKDFAINKQTLHNAIAGRSQRLPLERTRYKIRRFVELYVISNEVDELRPASAEGASA